LNFTNGFETSSINTDRQDGPAKRRLYTKKGGQEHRK